MTKSPVFDDERTVAVQRAGVFWAYVVLIVAVTADFFVRALVFRQACWDLLGLVVLSNVVGLFYRAAKRALPPPLSLGPRPLRAAILLALLGAVLSLLFLAVALRVGLPRFR